MNEVGAGVRMRFDAEGVIETLIVARRAKGYNLYMT